MGPALLGISALLASPSLSPPDTRLSSPTPGVRAAGCPFFVVTQTLGNL